ncbi:hypothetical protein V8C86DRAFT_2868941, partial [Haematococcus lacustris]
PVMAPAAARPPHLAPGLCPSPALSDLSSDMESNMGWPEALPPSAPSSPGSPCPLEVPGPPPAAAARACPCGSPQQNWLLSPQPFHPLPGQYTALPYSLTSSPASSHPPSRALSGYTSFHHNHRNHHNHLNHHHSFGVSQAYSCGPPVGLGSSSRVQLQVGGISTPLLPPHPLLLPEGVSREDTQQGQQGAGLGAAGGAAGARHSGAAGPGSASWAADRIERLLTGLSVGGGGHMPALLHAAHFVSGPASPATGPRARPGGPAAADPAGEGR